MAETITLEFLARLLDRVLTGQAPIRDDLHGLAAIVLRHENTLARLDETMRAILQQISAMVAQRQRFGDRLRRLEEQPVE